MSKFNKFIPALAVAVALAPFAAGAVASHGTQKAAYVSGTSISSPLAANSKGRSAEFTPAQSGQVAVNSKGRPSEFTPANEVAVNSKGRPSEFTPAPSNEVAANSKGRPGEYAAYQQVADNSTGRPGENPAPQYETPIG